MSTTGHVITYAKRVVANSSKSHAYIDGASVSFATFMRSETDRERPSIPSARFASRPPARESTPVSVYFVANFIFRFAIPSENANQRRRLREEAGAGEGSQLGSAHLGDMRRLTGRIAETNLPAGGRHGAVPASRQYPTMGIGSKGKKP